MECEKHLNLNISSNYYLIQNTIPCFKWNVRGKTKFISSLYTESVQLLGLSYYIIAKHALNGFMNSIEIELSNYAITVNIVSLSMTEIELISEISEKAKMPLKAKIPLSRLVSPEDFACAIDYLYLMHLNILQVKPLESMVDN